MLQRPETTTSMPTRSIDRLCRAFLAGGRRTVAAEGSEAASTVSMRFLRDGSVLQIYENGTVERRAFTAAAAAAEAAPIRTRGPRRPVGATASSPPTSSTEEEGHRGGAEEADRRALIEEIFEKVRSDPTISPNDKLLGLGIVWLLADVYALFAVHERLLSPEAEMFGAKGSEEVMQFKKNFLRIDVVNYDVDAVHRVDVANRSVVANFECLIPGREGTGTDVVKFSDDWKVVRVEAIRH